MPKVLILEDNVLIADILEDFLLHGKYEICGIARTVSEAVMLADLHKPDLAIMDFRLADGEYGSQVRPLLQDKFGMGILYASGDPLEGMLTKRDGEAYIQKPYSMNDLLQALRIVQNLKTVDAEILPFPKGFHLLADEYQFAKSA